VSTLVCWWRLLYLSLRTILTWLSMNKHFTNYGVRRRQIDRRIIYY
jgi:hypothetical protein